MSFMFCDQDFSADEQLRELVHSIRPSASTLTSLKLTDCAISPSGGIRLKKLLRKCVNMTELNLSGNELGDDGIKELCSAFRKCTMLKKLSLQDVNMSDQGAGELKLGLLECRDLESLDLSYNDVSDDGICELCDVFSQCTNLTKLNASKNRIGGVGLEALGKSLMKCANLQILKLSENGFEGETAEIGKMLRQCAKLKRLSLAINQFDCDSIKQICKGLKHCVDLERLNLMNNLIDDNAAEILAKALAHCSNLVKLNISENQIGDIGFDHLCKNLPDRLVALDISANRISSLPFDLLRFPFLSNFKASGNRWRSPPASIATRIEAAKQYVQELGDNPFPNTAIRLMFVGLGEAGKTSLIRALISDSNTTAAISKKDRTEGVNVVPWNPNVTHLNEDKSEISDLDISIWDFAGQQVYYVGHQLFLSQQCLYVLVWKPPDASIDPEEVENSDIGDEILEKMLIKTWLETIHQHVPDATVVLVASHAESLGSASIQHVTSWSSLVCQYAEGIVEGLNADVVHEAEELQQQMRQIRDSNRVLRSCSSSLERKVSSSSNSHKNKDDDDNKRNVGDEKLLHVRLQKITDEAGNPKKMALVTGLMQHDVPLNNLVDSKTGFGVAEFRDLILQLCLSQSFIGEKIPSSYSVVLAALEARWNAAGQSERSPYSAKRVIMWDRDRVINEILSVVSEDKLGMRKDVRSFIWDCIKHWKRLGRIFVLKDMVFVDPTELLEALKMLLHHDILTSSSFSLSEAKRTELLLFQRTGEISDLVLRKVLWSRLDSSSHLPLLKTLRKFGLLTAVMSNSSVSSKKSRRWLMTSRLPSDDSNHVTKCIEHLQSQSTSRVWYTMRRLPHGLFSRVMGRLLESSLGYSRKSVQRWQQVGGGSEGEHRKDDGDEDEEDIFLESDRDDDDEDGDNNDETEEEIFTIFECIRSANSVALQRSGQCWPAIALAVGGKRRNGRREKDGEQLPSCVNAFHQEWICVSWRGHDVGLLQIACAAVEDVLTSKFDSVVDWSCTVSIPSHLHGDSLASKVPLGANFVGGIVKSLKKHATSKRRSLRTVVGQKVCSFTLQQLLSLPPPNVFMSHCWNDNTMPFVRSLKDKLQEQGIQVWLDEEQLGEHSQLYKEMYRGIEKAKVVMLCATPRYFTRPNCQVEIEWALDNQNVRMVCLNLHPYLSQRKKWGNADSDIAEGHCDGAMSEKCKDLLDRVQKKSIYSDWTEFEPCSTKKERNFEDCWKSKKMKSLCEYLHSVLNGEDNGGIEEKEVKEEIKEEKKEEKEEKEKIKEEKKEEIQMRNTEIDVVEEEEKVNIQNIVESDDDLVEEEHKVVGEEEEQQQQSAIVDATRAIKEENMQETEVWIKDIPLTPVVMEEEIEEEKEEEVVQQIEMIEQKIDVIQQQEIQQEEVVHVPAPLMPPPPIQPIQQPPPPIQSPPPPPIQSPSHEKLPSMTFEELPPIVPSISPPNPFPEDHRNKSTNEPDSYNNKQQQQYLRPSSSASALSADSTIKYTADHPGKRGFGYDGSRSPSPPPSPGYFAAARPQEYSQPPSAAPISPFPSRTLFSSSEANRYPSQQPSMHYASPMYTANPNSFAYDQIVQQTEYEKRSLYQALQMSADEKAMLVRSQQRIQEEKMQLESMLLEERAVAARERRMLEEMLEIERRKAQEEKRISSLTVETMREEWRRSEDERRRLDEERRRLANEEHKIIEEERKRLEEERRRMQEQMDKMKKKNKKAVNEERRRADELVKQGVDDLRNSLQFEKETRKSLELERRLGRREDDYYMPNNNGSRRSSRSCSIQ